MTRRRLAYAPAELPFGDHHPFVRRVDACLEGKLTTNEIALLCQDLIEDGTVANWGPQIYNLVAHHVEMGLNTLTGRYTQ